MFSRLEVQMLLEGAPAVAARLASADPAVQLASIPRLDRLTLKLVREGVWSAAEQQAYLALSVVERIEAWVHMRARIGSKVGMCWAPSPTGVEQVECDPASWENAKPWHEAVTWWDLLFAPITGGAHRGAAEAAGQAGAAALRWLAWLIGLLVFLVAVVLAVVFLLRRPR